MKDSNWKCLGEKSSGIICSLKDQCRRNQFSMNQAHLFIAADFNSSDNKCENFLEVEKVKEQQVENTTSTNKKKKDSK